MLSALKQIPADPWLMVGVPLIATLVSGTIHFTVTHGEGFGPGSVNAQPATVVVSVATAIAAFAAVTCPLEGVTITVPPCGQLMDAEALIALPAIIAPSARRR
jgi:hypothetical protein